MNKQFFNFLEKLMEANPEVTNELMTQEIKEYIEVLRTEKDKKSDMTENGKTLLKFLQDNSDTKLWKAKDIADRMGISSRGIAGTLRKLVSDGYCEKLGNSPTIYSLTEQGREYEID